MGTIEGAEKKKRKEGGREGKSGIWGQDISKTGYTQTHCTTSSIESLLGMIEYVESGFVSRRSPARRGLFGTERSENET